MLKEQTLTTTISLKKSEEIRIRFFFFSLRKNFLHLQDSVNEETHYSVHQEGLIPTQTNV